METLHTKEVANGTEDTDGVYKAIIQPCCIQDLSIIRAEDKIHAFPSTRYYGSKRRLLPWIFENLKDLTFRTVLDGFGGTSSVSLLFKAMGKEVTYNDALLSNTIAAQALLANKVPFDNIEEVDRFFDSVSPVNGIISEMFQGVFYLNEENSWLDGVIQAIYLETELKRNIYLYCLFQACLQKRPFNLFHRANLNIRTNTSVKKSFGNQTTWDTSFSILAKRAYRELEQTIWRSPSQHSVLSPTDVSDLDTGYDLVYFDPPYINKKHSGDDYLRRYHFLEGLCQYKEWQDMIDTSYKNLQFKKKIHISEWQSRSYFKERLFSLINKHKKSIVVLSYVDNDVV
ncbi:MAG: DNA adenine methylase [Candidatus Polarisedimenticolaceae bacterium]|nr:DNA adenine methylase [Candidatus Polarisedimenticolaceae bacterium]